MQKRSKVPGCAALADAQKSEAVCGSLTEIPTHRLKKEQSQR
jgi:hypothetical protein